MQEKAKEPEIRFAGFTGAWEQRKFGEMANRRSEVSASGNLPRVEYEDIVSGTGTLNKDVFEKQSQKQGIVFHSGDVLYGKLRPYLQNWLLVSFNGLAVGDFWVLEPQGLNSNYLYRIIQTKQFDEIANQSVGTKMPRADWKLVSKATFLNPASFNEQRLIGKFFKDIDSLLTLHQRKYEKLLNIKKSMLEKMFPKEGEVVPEIRFKGFTGAWEQRKLGNLGETYTGLSGKSKEDFGHGTAKFITYMNVYSNPVSDPEGTDLIEVDNRQNTVRKGDVLFTTSSETPEEVGMSSVVFESIENTYLNSFCFGYRPKIEFNNFYLAFLLRSGGFRKNIIFLAQGISRYNISKNAVMNIPIPIPAKEEQEAIGDFFKHLDALLTLHQRKLEMLKNVKQAFLEKMFV